MPTPIQNHTTLGRAKGAQLDLPSLDVMRADLLRLEQNHADPQVRMLAGSQRTLVDHIRMQAAGMKMLANAITKRAETLEGKFTSLVTEIQALLAGPPESSAEVVAEVPQEVVAPAEPQPASVGRVAATPPASLSAASPAGASKPKAKPRSGGGEK